MYDYRLRRRKSHCIALSSGQLLCTINDHFSAVGMNHKAIYDRVNLLPIKIIYISVLSSVDSINKSEERDTQFWTDQKTKKMK